MGIPRPPPSVKRGNPKVVVGIPAWNEEKSIAKIVLLSKKFCDQVVVCDDGSADMTSEISAQLGAEVVKHKTNQGYGAALASIFEKALYNDADILVTIDGDGQHDPNSIPALVEPVVDGSADMVIGSRFIEGGATRGPGYRKAGIAAITKVSNAMTNNQVSDAQSGFRAYSRKAIQALRPTEMGMGASVEILSKAAASRLTIREVPIEVLYPKGSSTLNPVHHGLDVVMSSFKHLAIRHPLLSFGGPGAVALAVGLAFWLWAFQIYQVENRLVTNIALGALGASIVGIMLLTLGTLLWVLISVLREGQRGDAS